MILQSTRFKFFAKIMKRSFGFFCSSCISFNPTSPLKLDNIFFWKLHVFKINVIYFITAWFYFQKRIIKRKHKFFIKSIHEHIVEIFCNLILRNNWTWTRKILELPYCTVLDSGWFYDMLELDLKITQTTLLDLNWFYDILDLDLKNTWTNLLNSDLFW